MFRSGFKALFATFFGVIGITLGILVVVLVLGGIASSGKRELDVSGRYRILPNADGAKKPLQHDTPLILAIDVSGIIGTESLNADAVRKQLTLSQQGALNKGRVKGVLLLLNTPGGTVFDSDAIYRLLQEYKQRYQVPIYAYTEGLCASGGMYIASAADKFYGSPSSLIGSVGVVANFLNFSGTLEKIGVQTKILTRGIDKDAMNPLRPWKEGEDASMQKILSYYYDEFLSIVTQGRPHLSREKLVEEYGARVFPGPTAHEYGYIDGLFDTRSQALQALVEAAELQRYQVIQFEEKNWFECFIKGYLPTKVPQGLLYLYE